MARTTRSAAFGAVVACVLFGGPAWGMGGAKQNGDRPEAGTNLANTPTIQWVVKVKRRGHMGRGLYQFSTPLVVGDRVYVGAAGGRVVAINRQRGERVWSVDTDGSVVGPIRFADERLYFGDTKGILYTVQAGNGALDWRVELGGEIAAAPLVTDAVVYVVTGHGELIAVDRATGARKWRTARRLVSAPFTVKGASSPIFVDQRIVVGTPDGAVVAHEPTSGAILWEQSLTHRAAVVQDVDTTPVPVNAMLVVGTIDGAIAGLEARTGRVLWQAEGGTPNELTVADGAVYAAGHGRVMALETASGAVRWKTRLPESETSGPVVVGDKVLVVSTKDQVYVLNRADGLLVGKRHLGTGTYGHPTAAGDVAYVATNGGNIVALKIP